MSATCEVRLTVHGIPAAQGSKKHVGHGIMVEHCKALKPWREAVKWAVLEQRGKDDPCVMPDGPIHASIVFYMPRPKSRPKRDRWPDRRPDLDKLVRGIFDSLTQVGVYHDDGQVVALTTAKAYPGDPFYDQMQSPGCSILLTALDPHFGERAA